MRKVNFSKKAALTTAIFGVGLLVQACGAGSGSSSADTTAAAACVPGPGVTCTTVAATATNSTLYGACNSIYSAQSTGYYVVAAQYETSTDGTSVCQVAFEQSISYGGGRVYLGPNEPSAQGMATGVSLNPYDELALDVTGAYSTSVFCQIGSGNSINGVAYGYIQGVGLNGYFLLDSATASDPIVMPANIAGGQLIVGLNQSAGDSGCLSMSGYALINRCVDSGGTPHPCPSLFLQ